MHCLRVHHLFMEWQLRQYKRAVDEHKWYMSERLGYDVGWTAAEVSFVQNIVDGWAVDRVREWRENTCPLRHKCAQSYCFE